MVIFNNPPQCEAVPCWDKDALTRSDIVLSDAGHMGGTIVGADGNLSIPSGRRNAERLFRAWYHVNR